MTDGRARCRNCYHRDPATWELCGGCGQTKRVNARAADGTARCPNCRKSSQRKLPCDRCSTLVHPVVRAGGRGGHTETLGPCCYRNEDRLCGGCGRTRRVRVKATATSPDLCGTCHQAAITACTRCGIVTRCRGTVTARQPTCLRCHLADRLDELLLHHDSTILPALQPIRAAVLSVDNPATSLGWLGRSRGATLLAQLASGRLPLTHDTLDRQPPGFSIEHLRRMLVAAGALPERNEHLARLEAFAHRAAEAIDHPKTVGCCAPTPPGTSSTASATTGPAPRPGPLPDTAPATRSAPPPGSSPTYVNKADHSTPCASATSTHTSPAATPCARS
jgi:hypothetical protein